MKFKKLTMAAAISIGMMSIAASGALADCLQPACPVAPACPVNECCEPCCPQPACPCEPVCESCCPQPACPCEPCCDPCGAAPAQLPIPTVVSPACPCESCCPQPACPCEPCCDPCCDPCESCCPQPACPCDPCEPCCPQPACPVDTPACGACPNVSEDADMKGMQKYAFPESIFGGDTVTQAEPYTIGHGENMGVAVTKGQFGNCACQPLQQNAYDCGCNQPTGAAAALPCPSDYCSISSPVCGSEVNRCGAKLEGANCPITVKTCTSTPVCKQTFKQIQLPEMSGAACPTCVESVFEDIPNGYWASCDINKLVSKNVIAGYPDRTFKPNLPVSRAEFASLIVHGLNLDCNNEMTAQMFCDVSTSHWANSSIDKGVNSGYLAGYPDKSFKPNCPVSKAEAITTIAKAYKCCMDKCEAEKILSQYQDGCQVPSWARMSVAKALKSGILKGTPTPSMINPNCDASRAEVASMLAKARIALCIDEQEVSAACPCEPCGCEAGCAAYVQEKQIVDIPTLHFEMEDQLNARTSEVGEVFAGKTVDPICINGASYPIESRVFGEVVEVVRPNGDDPGALKIALTRIENGESEAKLPRQVLNAQVLKTDQTNWFSRTVEFPFTWGGQLLGTAGRTVGGAITNTFNGVEEVGNSFGIATGELFAGQFRASGKSYWQSLGALVMIPIDLVRTTLSGAAGLIQVSSEEIAYLLNPEGAKVSEINTHEKVSIAFGCQGQPQKKCCK